MTCVFHGAKKLIMEIETSSDMKFSFASRTLQTISCEPLDRANGIQRNTVHSLPLGLAKLVQNKPVLHFNHICFKRGEMGFAWLGETLMIFVAKC